MPQIPCARQVARLGWVPDVPDHRDYLYSVPTAAPAEALPRLVDLRPHCPPVYNQLNLGSCTANAIAGAIEFDKRRQQAAAAFMPSRLFIYYNERALEHTVATDSGASLRDGIKAAAAQGVCPETMWPYIDDGKTFEKQPSRSCYDVALQHRVHSYARVSRVLSQMKGRLAEGYPFVFGFSVYESFLSDAVAKDGIVPMPSVKEQLLGGHAVMAAGFDDDHNAFIVRNSWGPSWGIKGYCLMPYGYILNENLADDFWTIRAAS